MKKTFRLEGLECANCASKMEEEIKKLDGVNEVSVNFITSKLIIDAIDEKMPYIITSTEKIVKKIESGTVMRQI